MVTGVARTTPAGHGKVAGVWSLFEDGLVTMADQSRESVSALNAIAGRPAMGGLQKKAWKTTDSY
jgi:hypothetical protein